MGFIILIYSGLFLDHVCHSVLSSKADSCFVNAAMKDVYASLKVVMALLIREDHSEVTGSKPNHTPAPSPLYGRQ